MFGHFLLLRKEKELFIDWLTEEFGVKPMNAAKVYSCLAEWSTHHI